MDSQLTVIEGLGIALATFRQLADNDENQALAGFASAAEMLTAALIDGITVKDEEN